MSRNYIIFIKDFYYKNILFAEKNTICETDYEFCIYYLPTEEFDEYVSLHGDIHIPEDCYILVTADDSNIEIVDKKLYP